MLLCSGRLRVCVWYSCSPFSFTKEEWGESEGTERERKTRDGRENEGDKEKQPKKKRVDGRRGREKNEGGGGLSGTMLEQSF